MSVAGDVAVQALGRCDRPAQLSIEPGFGSAVWRTW
jgi:hypothetical protein